MLPLAELGNVEIFFLSMFVGAICVGIGAAGGRR